jgi:hypothetical protein
VKTLIVDIISSSLKLVLKVRKKNPSSSLGVPWKVDISGTFPELPWGI